MTGFFTNMAAGEIGTAVDHEGDATPTPTVSKKHDRNWRDVDMTKHLVFVSCICALLAALPASPARAAMSVVSDAELASISASSNVYSVAPSGCDGCDSSSLTQNASGSDGNIVVGSIQWLDDHSADQSINKGANDQSGANSQVQANVTATVNAIQWGVMANSVMVVTDLTAAGSLNLESHATMFLGGF